MFNLGFDEPNTVRMPIFSLLQRAVVAAQPAPLLQKNNQRGRRTPPRCAPRERRAESRVRCDSSLRFPNGAPRLRGCAVRGKRLVGPPLSAKLERSPVHVLFLLCAVPVL